MRVYADELAFEGYIALVIDLFRGKTASTDARQARLAQTAIADDVAIRAIAMWADWLRSRDFIDRRLGLVAFGPSCPWALAASRQTKIEPMAFFYGRVQFSERTPGATPTTSSRISAIAMISPAAWRYEMENRFRRIGSTRTRILSYPAGRNFTNPLSKTYDKPDAQVAWNSTLAFFIEQWGRPEK